MTQTLTTETIKLWRINAEITLGETDELDPENNAAKAILALTEELLANREAQPVAWTDAQELRDVEKDGCGYLFKANPITPHADPRRVIKLYTAPPAPVVNPELTGATAVPPEMTVDQAYRLLMEKGGVMSPVDSAVFAWNECRAAMLTQPQIEPQNIPDGLVSAVNRLLDSDGCRGRFDAIECHDAHNEVERLLAQPVSQQHDDTRRMDWLVAHYVEVRKPLLYGSKAMFVAQTITDEEDDYHATTLREQIDAAMLAAPEGGNGA